VVQILSINSLLTHVNAFSPILINKKRKNMKHLKQSLAIVIFSFFTFGCGMVGQLNEFKTSTEGFVTALMSSDYDKAVTYFDIENQEFGSLLNRDTLKAAMPTLQGILSKNFGDNLKVSFLTANKTYTTAKVEKKLPPNSIQAKATFEGDTHFGYLVFLLNEKNGKILHVDIENFKEPKPQTNKVYLFSLLGLLVATFNIYMLVRVSKSNILQKWKRIVTIIVLNVPTLGYNAVSGFFFKLLSFQFLLGASFGFADYASTYCAIGIPIGSLLVWWKMKNDMYLSEEIVTPTDDTLIDVGVDTPSV
jgi:hypothetical protein